MAVKGKPDIDGISLRMEAIWTGAEERIMQDIIRRIKKAGEITSTADYQINRLVEMGKSTEKVERILKEALGATWPEMFELYDEAAEWQYVRNKDVYEQVNGEFIPPEENEWLQQTSDAVKEQTKDELENLSRSYGFSVMMGTRRVFMPFATYYQRYVDSAIMDIISGGFDYNSVIRRVVTQMTNSGLRFVDYATGYSSRADVAARRSILTGVAQITAEVNERNAEELGTDYFEVDWHPAARPDHQAWQGKVYSREELVSVCGLGSKTGLCGINCRHVYYPFVPGVSERMYTDEWLEEQNRKEAETKEWHGKKLNAYEQTQQQRKMETAMRAQREKVRGFQEAGVDNDEITIAKCKYQAQLDEYKQFSKKMGLPEQRERIYQDMRGRVAPSKETYRKYTKEMIRNADRDSREFRKYKNILGDDAGSLAQFRQMKYNEPEKWEQLKNKKDETLKQMSNSMMTNLKGALSDREVRIWYKAQDERIPEKIDKKLPIEQQARRAFELRNEYRTQARELMRNQKARAELDREHPNPTFEQILEHKKRKYGLSDEEAYKDIIRSSGTTNKKYDKIAGVEEG
jgi:hypothetical protein